MSAETKFVVDECAPEAPKTVSKAVVEQFIAQLLQNLNTMAMNPQFAVPAKSMMCDLMVSSVLCGLVPMSFFTPTPMGGKHV